MCIFNWIDPTFSLEQSNLLWCSCAHCKKSEDKEGINSKYQTRSFSRDGIILRVKLTFYYRFSDVKNLIS
jgi:hypothetical protein